MIRKIALGTALIVGSVSGAFAFNNIGEIEKTPSVMHAPAGYDAFAASKRQAPVQQTNRTFYNPADVSAY